MDKGIEEPRELSREELRAVLEERVRGYFGLSLDEFLAAIDRDQLPNHPAATDLAVLVGAGSR